MPTLNALLIRMPVAAGLPSVSGAALGLAGGALEIEPLFATDGAPGLGVAGGRKQWYIARPTGSIAGASDWDLAYEALARFTAGPGAAPAALPDLIEPDLIQEWPHQ